jgi:hypothetical protein
LFSFGANQAKFLFELKIPCSDKRLRIVEDGSISGSPYHPARSYEDFSKNETSKLPYGSDYHI